MSNTSLVKQEVHSGVVLMKTETPTGQSSTRSLKFSELRKMGREAGLKGKELQSFIDQRVDAQDKVIATLLAAKVETAKGNGLKAHGWRESGDGNTLMALYKGEAVTPKAMKHRAEMLRRKAELLDKQADEKSAKEGAQDAEFVAETIPTPPAAEVSGDTAPEIPPAT